ncbi:hypothetical protein ACERII_22760 [Evansella sp. AB-rgal1]|uniref:hypothetical protein n=1 Tax=Evansella sp. AB-rgal1 TaxID=3242696 RepID=UPI00359EDB98
MKKENFMILGSILTVTGFILLFFSTNFGTSIANSWLHQQGGADTSMYHLMIKSYINNFLVTGGILFGIGLSTVIIACFQFANIRER